MMTKSQQAHFNMIEQQIRPWDVHAETVLDALQAIRREDFVPDDYAEHAFADIQVPLFDTGYMLEPKLAARMVQALDLKPEQRVLQIGVGSGYTSALLSRIAKQVVVVGEHAKCLELARRNLAMAGISNVILEQGDATGGWAEAGEFDGILIRGAVNEVSPALFDQLSQGGRLVAVRGSGAPMELMQYTKNADDLTAISIVDTVVPAVHQLESQRAFVF